MPSGNKRKPALVALSGTIFPAGEKLGESLCALTLLGAHPGKHLLTGALNVSSTGCWRLARPMSHQ